MHLLASQSTIFGRISYNTSHFKAIDERKLAIKITLLQDLGTILGDGVLTRINIYTTNILALNVYICL